MKYLIALVAAAFFLSIVLTILSFTVFHFSNPYSRFKSLYGIVVLDETLFILLAAALLIRPVSRRLDFILNRKVVGLSRPIKVLAALALLVGFVLFAFWVMVDIAGWYGGPGYAFVAYPFIASIYNNVWLFQIGGHDRMGIEGFVSFCIALLGLMTLRAKHGIGTAVREAVTLFAAPVIMVFELLIWSYMPADMYWKVTGFAGWSLGDYLTRSQVLSGPWPFLWVGNIYLLSNWIVLITSTFITVLGIALLSIEKSPIGMADDQIQSQFERPNTEDPATGAA